MRSRPAVFHLVAVDRRHDFKSETYEEEEDPDDDAWALGWEFVNEIVKWRSGEVSGLLQWRLASNHFK